MKKIMTLLAVAMIVLAMAGVAQAAPPQPMTLTINGSGSGSLGGTNFSNKAFTWTMTYDASQFFNIWGDETQPVFINPTSVITLEGVASPINVTENHGLWVGTTNFLSFAAIKVNEDNDRAGNNILTLTGLEPNWTIITNGPWDGRSTLSIASFAGMSDFFQFTNIATNQGYLWLNSGNVDGVSAAATGGSPVPEPGTILAALSILGPAGMMFRRRKA